MVSLPVILFFSWREIKVSRASIIGKGPRFKVKLSYFLVIVKKIIEVKELRS